MAFFTRINHSKLKTLSNHIKRCGFHVSNSPFLNSSCETPLIGSKVTPLGKIYKTPIEFSNNVRFYASPLRDWPEEAKDSRKRHSSEQIKSREIRFMTDEDGGNCAISIYEALERVRNPNMAPIEAKPKENAKNPGRQRLKELMEAPVIRLVIDEEHCVVSVRDALEQARKLELDLVEVQRNVTPPVYKLMDFRLEKYKKHVQEKARAKSRAGMALKSGCKEIRFSPKTEAKDLQTKAETVKRLMERGYRVKCMALGNEDQDLGGVLSRLSDLIEDVAVVESGPSVVKQQAYMIVRHVKFGSKKSGGKKKAESMDAKGQHAVKSQPSDRISLSGQVEEQASDETASEDEEEISDEDLSRSPHGNYKNVDPISRNEASGSRNDPSFATENGYRRNESDSRYASNPNHNGGQEMRGSYGANPQFPYQRRQQPSDMHSQHSMREFRERGIRDSNGPNPQFPHQRRQRPSDLHVQHSMRESREGGDYPSFSRNMNIPPSEISKQGKPQSDAPSPPPRTYGIFSAPKSNTSGN